MLRGYLRIRSRPALLIVTVIGLALMNVVDVISLDTHQRIIFGIAGALFFGLGLYSAVRWMTAPKQVDDTRLSAPTALTAIVGTASLLVSSTFLLHSWPHFLLRLLGWCLLMACWTMPKSNWQSLPMLALVVIAFKTINWKTFRVFAHLPLCFFIILGAILFVVLLVTLPIFPRRKADDRNVELN
jgi:hypothetical protein